MSLNSEPYSTARTIENAVLVGVVHGDTTDVAAKEHLDELAFLSETLGIVPGRRFMQRLKHPDPKFYIGSGKWAEIKAHIEDRKMQVVIFDDDLSPSQLRNIENELTVKIYDRSLLILDIFLSRAQTAQARTQVELARYEYLLPRLTRMWTHLERQRGGTGTRGGAGEKEIETDRRVIRQKISLLKEKLKTIDKQMATQRKGRGEMVRVALVGYTNVGKSTIMNLIARTEVLAENKLFATLDTTVRKVVFGNLPFLLSDTVGFIRKLPHQLVESFKSTLDEVREADLLLHVVDISHPDFEEHIRVVNETLTDIKAHDKPTILVFNKIDAYRHIEKAPDDLTEPTRENLSLEDLRKTWMARLGGDCLFISAQERINIDTLRDLVYQRVKVIHVNRFPYDNLLF
jgi:GTP-binding protein HflX